MKKGIIFLIILCLCFSMTISVYAEGETVKGGTIEGERQEGGDPELNPPGPEENSGSVILEIDSVHRYEGMKSAYKEGYTPTVSGGVVSMILPLICEGGLRNNKLTASVDLGPTENSPFQYENYQKDFSLSQQKMDGTNETAEIYYVRFDIKLSTGRMNGIYPVTIHISAKDMAGNVLSQSFTSYVSISDGISPDADTVSPGQDFGGDSSASSVETPTSAPVVLVTGCAVTPSPVEAGKEFDVVLTMKNTSSLKNVQNMVVTVTPPDATFELVGGTNTIFLGRLKKEETIELPLKWKVDQSVIDGNYGFSVEMSYDDPDASTFSSTGSFQVKVQQPIKVKLNVPKIGSSVKAGKTIPLSFQVMNLGRGEVRNVRCDVEGNGLVPTGTAFIGNLAGGSAGDAELNLFISSLEGESKYGPTTGTVRLTYEDVEGKVYTEEFPFDTEIKEPDKKKAKKDDAKNQKTAGQWWVSILIGGSIVAILAVGTGAYFFGKRKSHW